MIYTKFLTIGKVMHAEERMQFQGWQVSTLMHANKTDEVSCEGGASIFFHSTAWACTASERYDESNLCRTTLYTFWTEKPVFIWRIRVHPLPRPSLCVESLSRSRDRETILWLLN